MKRKLPLKRFFLFALALAPLSSGATHKGLIPFVDADCADEILGVAASHVAAKDLANLIAPVPEAYWPESSTGPRAQRLRLTEVRNKETGALREKLKDNLGVTRTWSFYDPMYGGTRGDAFQFDRQRAGEAAEERYLSRPPSSILDALSEMARTERASSDNLRGDAAGWDKSLIGPPIAWDKVVARHYFHKRLFEYLSDFDLPLEERIRRAIEISDAIRQVEKPGFVYSHDLLREYITWHLFRIPKGNPDLYLNTLAWLIESAKWEWETKLLKPLLAQGLLELRMRHGLNHTEVFERVALNADRWPKFGSLVFQFVLKPSFEREDGSIEHSVLRFFARPVTTPTHPLHALSLDFLKKSFKARPELLDDPAIDAVSSETPSFGAWVEAFVSGDK